MTNEEREALARARFGAIAAARAAGVGLMLLGLWIWYGDVLAQGGSPRIGLLLFALGFFQSLLLPRLLARRWRTPPE